MNFEHHCKKAATSELDSGLNVFLFTQVITILVF